MPPEIQFLEIIFPVVDGKKLMSFNQMSPLSACIKGFFA
jgi:hypothetical protein